jgi:hypothetical protein
MHNAADGDAPAGEGQTMTAVAREEDDTVVPATEEDLRQAVRGALQRCGLTYQQLAEQARTGRFSSVRARLAWVAIGDLGHLAT